MRRFLRVASRASRREDLVAFCIKALRGPKVDYKSYTVDKALREVLHLVLSAPQLVYATMIREWMGYKDTKSILKGDYETLGMFA